MDRKQLKAQSKTLIRTARPKPVVTAIIYLLILAVLSFLSYKLVGGYSDKLQDVYEQFGISFNIGFNEGLYGYDGHGEIDPDQFAYALDEAMPSPGAAILDLTIQIVTLIIGAGFTIFCLRTVRGMEASYWNLFDAFGMFFRVIWLYILEGVFIFLWSLLFIIPGFIAFYRYRQALYLLLEHPEMSALQCISESKRIMAGHKGELFVMDLSFFGWALLVGLVDYLGAELASAIGPSVLAQVISIVGLGIFVQFFVLPYMDLTYAGYYVELTRPAHDAGFADGWTPEL